MTEVMTHCGLLHHLTDGSLAVKGNDQQGRGQRHGGGDIRGSDQGGGVIKGTRDTGTYTDCRMQPCQQSAASFTQSSTGTREVRHEAVHHTTVVLVGMYNM